MVTIRIDRKKSFGKYLTIVKATVSERAGNLEIGELIDVVAEGEDLAHVFGNDPTEHHRLLEVEEEPNRNRVGHRVFKLIKYGGRIEEVKEETIVLRPKSERAQVFADFLISTFEEKVFDRVIDVAGGRGELSIALKQRLPPCRPVVIEPVARPRSEHRDEYEETTRTIKSDAVETIREKFSFPLRDGKMKSIIQDATCIIALHPDEATEAAVCVAAQRGLPFAVVPCCVFPKRFSSRRQFWLFDPAARRQKVRQLDTFLTYLKHRAQAFGLPVHMATLPLEGCNQVLYSYGQAPASFESTVLLIIQGTFDFLSLPFDIMAALSLNRQWNREIRFIARTRRVHIENLIRSYARRNPFHFFEVLKINACDRTESIGGFQSSSQTSTRHAERSLRFSTLRQLRHHLFVNQSDILTLLMTSLDRRPTVLQLFAIAHASVLGPLTLTQVQTIKQNVDPDTSMCTMENWQTTEITSPRLGYTLSFNSQSATSF